MKTRYYKMRVESPKDPVYGKLEHGVWWYRDRYTNPDCESMVDGWEWISDHNDTGYVSKDKWEEITGEEVFLALL